MSVNPKRFRALPIAVAALAVPMMVPVAANAALGGANAGTTTLLPDLRSAAVTNVSGTGETTIRVCFNKTIASVPTAGGIIAGSYHQAERASDSAARVASAQNCLDAVWNTLDIESKQRTYVRVAGGAVANLANGFGNLPDATALNGSDTSNGTRGHAVSPDLEGITTNLAANAVNFVFDQRVDAAFQTPLPNTLYAVTRQDGSVIQSTGNPGDVSFSGNVVSVRFPAAALGTAGNPPVRATVEPGAVVASPAGHVNLSRMSAAVPGSGGLTNNPDLLSANLATDGTYVDFVFDENIAAGPAFNGAFPAGNFHGIFSALTGVFNPAAANKQIINNNTVRVTFPGLSNFNEYLVWAMVGGQSVVGTNAPAGRFNAPQGVPAGGNAGAKGNGFTTGPEALTTTFDNTTGVVSIRLDQRFNAFAPPAIRLVDDAGALIPGTPIAVAGAGGAAGQVTAQAQFTPGQVTGARSVLLNTGAFTAPLANNVSQIISPTAPAKYTRKNGKVVRRAAKRVSAKSYARAAKRATKRGFKRVR